MVMMRAIQPLFVWGPWGPIPPRKNLVISAKKRPAPKVEPPHLRSWLVPSSDGAGPLAGGFRVGAGWIAGANAFF